MKILVLEYSCGNIGCIKNIFQYLDAKVFVYPINSFKEIDPKEFDIVVLPGVGNFQHASNYFEQNIDFQKFRKWMLCNRKVIAICLGFQLLFSESEESAKAFSPSKGLDFIRGKVSSLSNNENLSLNIGWCKTLFNNKNKANKFDNLLNNHYFYHMHSFGIETKYIKDNININWYSTSIHNNSGTEFVSALHFDNVYGFQFHPEKSGKNGLRLIESIMHYG